jgi:hypothetical protein
MPKYYNGSFFGWEQETKYALAVLTTFIKPELYTPANAVMFISAQKKIILKECNEPQHCSKTYNAYILRT